MNILEIIPKDNYLLYVKTDDGRTGLFDVNPYLDSEAFAPLKDRSEFIRIHNGKYFIEEAEQKSRQGYIDACLSKES
jgi:hypothetical protein